ncbi:MAG: elongation factor P maturation arginine rhamnosyltransferase EarP [Chitinispirillaceae bacterium]|nr:elongation factor P maturation arginine rhamnosyltransferase EarP [Chitinispirillaceae bacterium]
MHFSSIDTFCHVIDNFGDTGTVYRFASELGRYGSRSGSGAGGVFPYNPAMFIFTPL